MRAGSLVSDLSIATFPEGLVLDLVTVASALIRISYRFNGLLYRGVTEGIPVLACASKRVLSLVHLVLVLVDLQLLLVHGVVPWVIFAVANNKVALFAHVSWADA